MRLFRLNSWFPVTEYCRITLQKSGKCNEIHVHERISVPSVSISKKNNLKINLKKNTLLFHISIKFFQNLKKRIEFRRYFTHGLVLQRQIIKAWSLLARGRVYLK